MKKIETVFVGALAAACLLAVPAARADGTKPVTSGAVIRGVTLTGAGTSGASASAACDFSGESVTGGKMDDASVNCKPNAPDVKTVLKGLPARFNAYCVISSASSLKTGRLIQSSMPDNANHCSLSDLKPSDAQSKFGTAVWR